MESEEAVHNYLMENWRFPTIMEKSDALSDMLTDGAAGNVCVELVRCTALDAPVKKFEAKLETVLEDAAQTVEERMENSMPYLQVLNPGTLIHVGMSLRENLSAYHLR